MTDRNHFCTTLDTGFLLLGKSIDIDFLCWKISKDFIIGCLWLTGLCVSLYFDILNFQFNRSRFVFILKLEQIHLSWHLVMTYLAGGAKKFCLQIVQLSLKICDKLILFSVFCITLLQHLLHGTNELVLSADCCIQL